MTTTSPTETRAPLTRERILDAALQYIDRHGLETLSMHKLGAELGVKGMSLYNHVANKHDLLDGVVELLWAEVEAAALPQPQRYRSGSQASPQRNRSGSQASPDWQQGFRSVAHAIRNVVHRHPNAGPLITTQQVMPAPALRVVRTHITVATGAGVPEAHAYALLRTITSYALGFALAYVSYGLGCPGCAPAVSDLLRPGVPDELAAVAEVFCGQSDPDAQFELGLDLMTRGS